MTTGVSPFASGAAFATGWFRRFAEATARAVGSGPAFVLAVLLVIAWIATGPIFRYSMVWHTVITTVTTILTFLMVFLLQATQLRDTKAIHLKLDELLRALNEARTEMVGLERLPDEQLAKISDELQELAEQHRSGDQECEASGLGDNA